MKFLLFLALSTLLEYTDAACYSDSSPILCSDSSCGGSCTPDNGCFCSDYITQCVPVSSQCPMADNSCCNMLTNWFWDSSLACCTETAQCTPACSSDEICYKTDNGVTCLCNQTTYKDNTPYSVVPTVSCDGGAMVTSVSLCQLKQIRYNASSFHIRNTSNACTYSYEETINGIRVQSFQLRAAVGWCGNSVTSSSARCKQARLKGSLWIQRHDNVSISVQILTGNDSSKIYFTNTLYIDPFYGPLITKNPIVYNFSCAYNLTMQTSLNFSLNPVLSSIDLPSPGAVTGFFTVIMAAYSDAGFVSPIEQGDEISVGSNIYLGIFAPDLDGSALVLRIEKCVATPTKNPSDPTNVQLVSGGCAVSNEISSVVLKNGVSNEVQIQIAAFLFRDYTEVYIFCDVTLCNKTSGCDSCNSGRSEKTDSSQLGIQLKLQQGDYDSSSGHHTAASWAMLAASLLGLLSVKLF